MKIFKLFKRHIGKKCVVFWYDAISEYKTELEDFKKQGLEINFTDGEIDYFDDDKIIVSNDGGKITKTDKDRTAIPRGNVISVFFYCKKCIDKLEIMTNKLIIDITEI